MEMGRTVHAFSVDSEKNCNGKFRKVQLMMVVQWRHFLFIMLVRVIVPKKEEKHFVARFTSFKSIGLGKKCRGEAFWH